MLTNLASSSSNRLTSIDALRGFAALVVVFAHVHLFIHPHATVVTNGLANIARSFALTWGYGRTGVFLFFVISGFCIHLRWAKAKAKGLVDKDHKLGFIAFWKRRMWRLYPTYVVVLIIAALVLWIKKDPIIEYHYGWNLIMHFLMLHNISVAWFSMISVPFWTLAVEEQLYLAYFALLWLRRKFGWGVTLSICITGRLAWDLIGWKINNPQYNLLFDLGMPNYWIIWALGAVAVEAYLGIIKLPAWCKKITNALLLLLLACCGDYVLARFYSFNDVSIKSCLLYFVVVPLWGVGFFVLLNAIVDRENEWKIKGLFSSVINNFAKLGIFSYSLYLTHQLIFEHFLVSYRKSFGMNEWAFQWLESFAYPVTAIVLAWGFFQLIERHFMQPVESKIKRAHQ